MLPTTSYVFLRDPASSPFFGVKRQVMDLLDVTKKEEKSTALGHYNKARGNQREVYITSCTSHCRGSFSALSSGWSIHFKFARDGDIESIS
jgi:hypothetical protein